MGVVETESFSPTCTAKSEAVLNSISALIDLNTKKGNTLNEEEDQIRKFILYKFPELCRAPTAEEIGRAFNMPLNSIVKILRRLNELDIIYLDINSNMILGAYPFSSTPTAHQVILKGEHREGRVYAMCAIDALGVPFMFEKDVDIHSSCGFCSKEVSLKVCDGKIVS
jgi:hypothetical protein